MWRDSLEQENLKAVRGFDGASGGERDDKITITGRIMSEGTRSNEDLEQQTLARNLVHHQFQDWRPLQKAGLIFELSHLRSTDLPAPGSLAHLATHRAILANHLALKHIHQPLSSQSGR